MGQDVREPVSRRELLRAGAAGGAWLALGLPLLTSACSSAREAEAPKGRGLGTFEISLAEWSLHRALTAGELDHLDFPRVAREDYGIGAVEYVNTFFKDKAEDPSYLAEMKRRADGEGVRSLLIMCDGEGAIGDPDESARQQTVENHYRWVDAASYLGCHSIRVNAQSRGGRQEQMELAADGLRRLTEHASRQGISVLVENHGGLSSDGTWLASVIQKVGHPDCGTLPDFGNFNVGIGRRYDRYLGVEQLMPYAKAVSAKTYAFDADGNETTIDYARMLKIVQDSGYRGFIGIEYEGPDLDEYEGIRSTKSLLER